ncbi:MAG: outer membrane beta-barrel protein [Prevotella sp.]|nr:outer membrane beta-barrel protein [Prevotella sp.]
MALILLAVAPKAAAQDDVEYRMEIGAGVGMTAYQGDFNDGLFKGMQPSGALVFRAIVNPYMAVRVSAMYAQVKGDIGGVTTVYPALLENGGYSFKNTLGDLSATYEYNFLPYGTGHEYRGAQRITPFISLGFGMTYVKCKDGKWDYSSPSPYSSSKSVVTANVPIGVGVKCKIADRLNLSLDWQMHFSLSDYIDGVKDPYRISSSGLFKNTDCYSTLMLALTYSFSPKCPDCQKER